MRTRVCKDNLLNLLFDSIISSPQRQSGLRDHFNASHELSLNTGFTIVVSCLFLMRKKTSM